MTFPKFIYETLGTAIFIIVSSSAIKSADTDATKALYFALSWALMHVTFATHCQAFFNPVLTLGEYVFKGLEDTAEMVLTIVGQILGSMVGASVMSALTNGEIKVPAVDLIADNMAQNLVLETLAVAALVYLFFTPPTLDLNKNLWTILIFFTLTMVAANRMNPARYFNSIVFTAFEEAGEWGGPSKNDVAVMVGSIVGSIGGALLRKFNNE